MLSAGSASSDHISGLKRPSPVITIDKITYQVYSLKLRTAGIEFFILICRQCPRHRAKHVSGGFVAVEIVSEMLRLLTKEVETDVDSDYISNPFLRWWQRLIGGGKGCLTSYHSRQALKTFSQVPGLFCGGYIFSISYSFYLEVFKDFVKTFPALIAFMKLYIYKVGHAFCPCTQV